MRETAIMNGVQKRRTKVSVLLLAVFVVAFLVVAMFHKPKAEQRQNAIIAELACIPDPPGTRVVDSWSGYKPSDGGAGRRVASRIAVNQIRLFYMEKLEQRGWTFCREEVQLYKHVLFFQRGEDNAVLIVFEPASAAPSEYSHSLGMSWPILFECKEKRTY